MECRAVARRRAVSRLKIAAWRQAPALHQSVTVSSFVIVGPTAWVRLSRSGLSKITAGHRRERTQRTQREWTGFLRSFAFSCGQFAWRRSAGATAVISPEYPMDSKRTRIGRPSILGRFESVGKSAPFAVVEPLLAVVIVGHVRAPALGLSFPVGRFHRLNQKRINIAVIE